MFARFLLSLKMAWLAAYDELHKLGVIKSKAASWKNYFFDEAHSQPRS